MGRNDRNSLSSLKPAMLGLRSDNTIKCSAQSGYLKHCREREAFSGASSGKSDKPGLFHINYHQDHGIKRLKRKTAIEVRMR